MMAETTEEKLERLAPVAVTEIRLTERGIELLNQDREVIFIIPVAGSEGR